MASSSLPEPPLNVPRIVEVQDPSTGHYVVMVRMPTNLAAKWPDKPWGTAIDAIGLSSKDSDLYPGYTLVDVEPMKGSPDLYWIFQKLDGPVWTTKSKGQGSLVPAKYRRLITTTESKQEVDPDTLPDDIAAPLVSSAVQQQMDTGKAIKVNTEEEIDVDGDPLLGQVAYEQRQVADVTGSLVDEGEAADAGLLIISSQVTPNGDGTSVKETVSVDEWVEHTKAEWNNDLMGHVVSTEKFVAPSEVDTPVDHASYQIVNEDRILKITEVVPTDALDNYVISYPVRVSLDLPRILKSVAIVWNEGSDVGQRDNWFNFAASGTSYTASGENSDVDNSSVSLNPEVQIEWEDYSGNNLFATAYLFYLPLPVESGDVLAKVAALAGGSVSQWPVFKTRSHTITTMGQSASVRVQTSAGISRTISGGVQTAYRNQEGTGDDIGKNLNNGTVQIPPCIHGAITFSGLTSRTATVSAMATSPIYVSDGTSILPVHSRSVTVSASVSPSSLAATSPSSVPTSGLYLVDAKVQPYEYGYAKVYAEVFDASNLDTDP